ncbi:MAG: molecular chaperone TorD family protein [Magnetococcales bacterium]|nr:molecular chaperone TorD family protein [Magnetococcales bacterium]
MTDQTLAPTGDEALEGRMEALLKQAALFRLLALCFTYPQEERQAQMRQQLDELRDLSPVEVAEAFETLRERWSGVDLEALQALHCRLFQGRNVISLHETSYGDAQRIGGQVVELSDINGFYRAFGMQVSDANPEMPDHLCTELEFYSLLLVKQAYALDNEWAEEEAVTADASRKFLEHHLGRWLAPMLDKVREHGEDSIYLSCATLLERVIAAECQRQEVVPQPFAGAFPMDEMKADVFTCPMAAKPEGEAPPV